MEYYIKIKLPVENPQNLNENGVAIRKAQTILKEFGVENAELIVINDRGHRVKSCMVSQKSFTEWI